MSESEMGDIPVVLRDLPGTIRGFVCLGEDYEPMIVLNSALPKEEQRKAFIHEVRHISSGELYDDDYVEYG